MKHHLAGVISFIALPIWIPVFISLLIQQGILMGICSSVVLLFLILAYKKIGLIHSVHLSTRSERLLPLATSLVIYLVFSSITWYYSIKIHDIFLLAAITVLGLYILSLWDKVSIHVGGTVAGCMWIIERYQWRITSIFLAIGTLTLVIWARMYLKAHTGRQIVSGGIVGAVSYFIFYLMHILLC
ncbi:MAG: hypothetical protein NZ455_10325 [Bacteroidia bacterium]|nr:hypothetical protein [Bacteroidia bacterium]MDW8345592.1 hypothetical protein [Bacteroidia bacterium]